MLTGSDSFDKSGLTVTELSRLGGAWRCRHCSVGKLVVASSGADLNGLSTIVMGPSRLKYQVGGVHDSFLSNLALC